MSMNNFMNASDIVVSEVDVVALCDASEQIIHNATLIIKINFQFRLLSSSTNNPSVKSGQSSLQPFMKVVMQPTVPITVLRHKKCYLSSKSARDSFTHSDMYTIIIFSWRYIQKEPTICHKLPHAMAKCTI